MITVSEVQMVISWGQQPPNTDWSTIIYTRLNYSLIQCYWKCVLKSVNIICVPHDNILAHTMGTSL
jgi:hypothetical protein